jgi:ATP-dependent exoDNAse (exonuclease V) beta subunit
LSGFDELMGCARSVNVTRGIGAVGDEADLADIYETERQLLYVAYTRAREHLLVGVEPESEFLEDFNRRCRVDARHVSHWRHIYDVAAEALPGVTATRVLRRLGTGVRAATLQPEMLLHAVQSSGTASSPEQQNRETNV